MRLISLRKSVSKETNIQLASTADEVIDLQVFSIQNGRPFLKKSIRTTVGINNQRLIISQQIKPACISCSWNLQTTISNKTATTIITSIRQFFHNKE